MSSAASASSSMALVRVQLKMGRFVAKSGFSAAWQKVT
jgi:hypothetical protein